MGGIRSEFEAMKPRDANVRRGKLLEEQYEALWLLLNHEEASFKGEYVEFHDISINPKPLQKPLPLLITGEDPINAERVAKWGTGWATNNSELPKIRQLWEILLPLLEQRGRDPAEIEMNTGMTVTMASTHEEAVKTLNKTLTEDQDGEAVAAKRLVGTPEEIAEKLHKLEEDGLNHLIVRQSRRDIPFDELKERIQAFAEDVLPLLR
jgi:alkanesulfonate monooxygenase SsuD/methylene tetrahydromethanopterin reductase-like flavin-dependent oxidoreductase (luciferase family)